MKRMVFLINLLLFVLGLFGQTSNVVTNTLQGDGYTYIQKIDSLPGFVILYSNENIYVDVPQVYKSTGLQIPMDLREKWIEDDNWSYNKSREIVNDAFSVDQRLRVSDRKLGIGIYIDSMTGRIVDVVYYYLKRGPFAQIPLSVFREIEVKLKEEIYFTLTEAGRNVNYVFLGWNHEVK